MAIISRIRDAQITNGNVIDADDLDAELNQLVNAHNTNDGRIVAIESGDTTLDGVKTFTDPLVLSTGTATIATGAVAVTDQVMIIDTEGAAASDDLTTLSDMANGQIVILRIANSARNVVVKHNTGNILLANETDCTLDNTNDTLVAYYDSALTKAIEISRNVSGQSVSPKYKAGPHCVYASAATVTLKSGYSIIDSTGATYLTFTADQTISLASAGAANALDTGSEASNTWYYVYAISDGVNVRGLFSTVNEAVSGSITLPSGYTLKAQTPYVWRNDGSSNLIKGRYVGASNAPTFWYNAASRGEGQTGTAGTTEFLTNGAATTFTAASAASFIPPTSRFGWFYNSTAGSQNGVGIRATGESHNGIEMSGTNSGAGPVTPCETDSSQSIDYRRVDSGAANAWIAVAGFEITEIA